MSDVTSQFQVKLATTAQDLRAAQRLRYEVFVEELGGDGPVVDHQARLECDRYDPFYDHLILTDTARNDAVVGVYRLLKEEQAQKAGRFYSEEEYDLSILKDSGRELLELGRSCVAKPYRGGAAMYHLWNGLAAYIEEHSIDILFGVASFHGTNPEALSHPLSLLHHRYLAPPELRVCAQPDVFQSMDLIAEDRINRRTAMQEIPALIKAYLRLGGVVGKGAYVDHKFNTTDICMIMDTARMNTTQKTIYSREYKT